MELVSGVRRQQDTMLYARVSVVKKAQKKPSVVKRLEKDNVIGWGV